MSKREQLSNKKTKLNSKAPGKSTTAGSGIVDQQDKEFKRATFTLTQEDIHWLDRAIKQYNRNNVRTINKSELLRILINKAREEGDIEKIV